MKLKLLAVMLLAVPLNAAAVNVTPGMTTAQIQAALNGAASGSTVSFAAGSYNITSALTVPCNGLNLTGPVAAAPTANLNASYTGDVILTYPGNCMNLGSVRYLGFANTGAVYAGWGNSGNYTFEHNTVSKLPSGGSNIASEAGLFFDGNMSSKLSNILVRFNTFGDANSCTVVFADVNDQGGYCVGVITTEGEVNNMVIVSNTFEHVEQGVKFNQIASYNPGQPNSVCVSCTVSSNYIAHYHRIGIEIQTSTPTNSIMLEHNVVIDPLNSSWGTFAVSLACCQSGYTIGQNGFSPALIFNDNVLISTQPPGSKPPPYGVEFWGTGSQGLSSLVQGNFSNGYTWGYGGGSWAINQNMICGPNYVSQGGYISNQQGQTNPPTQSGNVTNTQCSTTTSKSPSITPAGGTFTGSQVVTLTDSGPNTSIWYTLDGSTPVPGIAKLYSAPITITATTTVKAVGMWGTGTQPTSYAANYGYVPSAVVSATYTAGVTPPPTNCTIITLNPNGTYTSTTAPCGGAR